MIVMINEAIMKTSIRGGIFHFTNYALFFLIILVQSCASTSTIRLEGNDFKENLPGLWEGRWYYGTGGPTLAPSGKNV